MLTKLYLPYMRYKFNTSGHALIQHALIMDTMDMKPNLSDLEAEKAAITEGEVNEIVNC